MSIEPQNGDRDQGRAPPGEPDLARPDLGDGWGWALMQLDWSLRQRAPAWPRLRVLAGVRARVTAVIAVLRRAARTARRSACPATFVSPTGGGGSGTRRSSARRP